jgi:ribonuclease HI
MNNTQMIITLPNIKLTPSFKTKIYPVTEYVLYFDGCSKGNPGHAGIGAVIYKDGVEHWAASKYIGNKRTNNEAEYCALILGLKMAIEQDITTLSVCGDSLLVINQVNKVYKVKNPILRDLYDEVDKLKSQFTYIDFNHVYRKDNKRADELSNLGLECSNNSEEEITIDDIIEDFKNWEEGSTINNIFKNSDANLKYKV